MNQIIKINNSNKVQLSVKISKTIESLRDTNKLIYRKKVNKCVNSRKRNKKSE